MSEYYCEDCARGIRFDDLAFGIRWPMMPDVVSQRDAAFFFTLRKEDNEAGLFWGK